MKSLTECLGKPLRWAALSAGSFELQSGEAILGRLSILRGGAFADASCAAGRWSFKSSGFFSPRITVRVEGGHENLAVFSPKWGGGGSLAFAGGASYAWERGDTPDDRWDFRAPDGLILVSVSGATGDVSHPSGTCELSIAVADEPALPILTLLGWYLFVLAVEDAQTAVPPPVGG